MQAEGQSRLDGRRKVKFQIQQELGAKPKTSKVGDYKPGLTEWLVRTNRLVSVEEFSAASIHRGSLNTSCVI